MNATSHDTTNWAALPVLLAGAFMVVLDFFIVNVALPSIATDLGAGDSSLEWIVAGYGLTFAAFLITAGRLGDDLGRRRVYAIGLALFTIASAACGLAPSPTTLIVARIAQGVAGAIVMPQVLAILGVTYRGPDYVRAMSFYGMALGLAAVGGQLVGGALVDADVAGLGWRSCFLINVPIGLIALALAPRLVPESRAERRKRIDVLGAAIVAVGLTAILLPLIEGRELGWPAWTWASLAAAPVLLSAFVLRQRRLADSGGDPLLELALFRERGFSAGIATQLFLATAQASFFVFLAIYLQLGRGLTALEAGLVFTILAVAYVATSGPAPGLTAALRAAGRGGRRSGADAGPGPARPGRVRDRHLRLAAGAGARPDAGGRGHRPLLHAADLDRARQRRAGPGRQRGRRDVHHHAGRLRARRGDHGRDLLRRARDRPCIRVEPDPAGGRCPRASWGWRACFRGIRQMSHKHNKTPIPWLRRHGARPHRHLPGSRRASRRVRLLRPRSRADRAAAHAVAATAGERFRITEMSADDVVELRELTALADELGELTGAASTLVLRPARLSTLLNSVARFVESREQAEWIREEDRQPLALLREMLFPLEQLSAEATRTALSPAEHRSHS